MIDERQVAAAERRRKELGLWLALASAWEEEFDEISQFLDYVEVMRQQDQPEQLELDLSGTTLAGS